MKEIKMQVYSQREKLYVECYEALGFHVWNRTRESDTSALVDITFHGEDAETKSNALLRRKCEGILDEIKQIDVKAERYYLERVVLVGLIGALCIGLSFLFLHLNIRIIFAMLLLIGLILCSVTLTLRPLFISMGLKKFGAEIPKLTAQLEELLEEADTGREDAE